MPKVTIIGIDLAGPSNAKDTAMVAEADATELRAVVDGIEQRSEASHGSRFAAYRVYEQAPAELLAWVGIVPA